MAKTIYLKSTARRTTGRIKIRVLLDKPRDLQLNGPALKYLRIANCDLKSGWTPACIRDVATILYAASMSDQHIHGTVSFEKFLDCIYACHLQDMTSVMGELIENRPREITKLTAPYVPTPIDFLTKGLDMLPAGVQHFFDIGCGDGRALALALKRGIPNVAGVDTNSDQVATATHLLAQVQAKLGVAVTTATVKQQNALEFDFSTLPPNSAVFMYLMPDIVAAMAEQFKRTPAGTHFIMHDFIPTGWDPQAVVTETFQGVRHRMYHFVVGEHSSHTIDIDNMTTEDHELIAVSLANQIFRVSE
jgi:SAM-dependent methyltransferase